MVFNLRKCHRFSISLNANQMKKPKLTILIFLLSLLSPTSGVLAIESN